MFNLRSFKVANVDGEFRIQRFLRDASGFLWAAETSFLANSAAWISAKVSSLGTFVLMSQWGGCSPLLFKNKSTTLGPSPRVLAHIPGGVLELWTFCTVVSALVTNLRPLLGSVSAAVAVKALISAVFTLSRKNRRLQQVQEPNPCFYSPFLSI